MDDLLETSDVMSLAELQKFLADEITKAGGSKFDRAFTPITDGLGLESPREQARKAPLTFPTQPAALPETKPQAPVIEKRSDGFGLRDALGVPERTPSDQKLFDQMRALRTHDSEFAPKHPSAPKTRLPDAEEPPVDSLLKQTPSVTPIGLEEPTPRSRALTPPPLEKPSGFRRLQATILDEVFVISIFFFALLISANLFPKTPGGWMARLGNGLNNPIFIRFALLEYTTLWLAYLAIGVGLLDATFGMWVWGLRVSYGNSARLGFRKWLRIVFSFAFMAPIFPLSLLAIRIRGKNLIDKLSSSHLYLSTAD